MLNQTPAIHDDCSCLIHKKKTLVKGRVMGRAKRQPILDIVQSPFPDAVDVSRLGQART
jgi:hypothetical protein